MIRVLPGYYPSSIEFVKLSVSLSDDDVAVLDAYVEKAGLPSRSAGLQRAIRMLRYPTLEDDYDERMVGMGRSRRGGSMGGDRGRRAWQCSAVRSGWSISIPRAVAKPTSSGRLLSSAMTGLMPPPHVSSAALSPLCR